MRPRRVTGAKELSRASTDSDSGAFCYNECHPHRRRRCQQRLRWPSSSVDEERKCRIRFPVLLHIIIPFLFLPFSSFFSNCSSRDGFPALLLARGKDMQIRIQVDFSYIAGECIQSRPRLSLVDGGRE